jgi:hypothetical protein
VILGAVDGEVDRIGADPVDALLRQVEARIENVETG